MYISRSLNSGLLFKLGRYLVKAIFINIIFFSMGLFCSLPIFIVMLVKLKSFVKHDFVQIANNTIKEEQEDLRKQHREALEEKLLPITKELGEFKEKVDKFNLSGVENTTKIIDQLNILEKNNKIIELESKKLTEALTKNQNIKGAYGEELLDTILQNSGFVEGIHYKKQYSTVSENAKDNEFHMIRPDIIINLPKNRHLVIDSKVTLSSYLEYINDNSKLKDFKAEVKRRISDLANKNYNKIPDINQPDFIIMYIPIEQCINLLYEDSELITYAYKSNIIIAGTASILAVIRLVNQLFVIQKQNENVQQIVEAGTNLYETFAQLCNELVSIQKDFEKLTQEFTTTINRFQRTNKNKPSIFSQINELKKLGVNSTKEIPDELLKECID